MAAIILAIVQLFGPIVAKWIQDWLESRLKRAAEQLPPATAFASDGAAASALFDKAIANEWWFNVRARRRLRNAKAHTVDTESGKLFSYVHPLAAGDLQ